MAGGQPQLWGPSILPRHSDFALLGAVILRSADCLWLGLVIYTWVPYQCPLHEATSRARLSVPLPMLCHVSQGSPKVSQVINSSVYSPWGSLALARKQHLSPLFQSLTVTACPSQPSSGQLCAGQPRVLSMHRSCMPGHQGRGQG